MQKRAGEDEKLKSELNQLTIPLLEPDSNSSQKEFDQKTNNLVKIIQESENLLNSERNIDGNPKYLKSIFSNIKGINEGEERVIDKYYRPQKLNFNNFTYPENFEKLETASKGYNDIYSSFKNTIPYLNKYDNEDLLLMFLEENTSFIPSETNDDISLFDHIKTRCAIATSLYKYHETEINQEISNKISDKDENKYLLIGGDVSGIQKFIYSISSKGALKLLRGRSFYIEMFCTDIVNKIVKELDLPNANVLYSGGGNFFILAPNTEATKTNLKEIDDGIESWLIDNNIGNLYLALSYEEFPAKSLKEFSNVVSSVNSENSKKKSRKYSSILCENPDNILIKEYDNKRNDQCDACNKIVSKENLKLIDSEKGTYFCNLCSEQFDLGKKIAQFNKYFYIVKTEPSTEIGSSLSLPFSSLKLMKESELAEYNVSMIYSVNNWNINNILNLIDNQKVTPDIDVSPLPIAVYSARMEDENKVPDLDKLAENSHGPEKIGALRMDVDNLGKIFSSGLTHRDITRVSNLSRFMNYFFKGYLNLLGEFDEENLNEILKDQNKNIRLTSNRSPQRSFNIIYAGGDDLFIIGSWDDIFELSFDVESAFKKYVGVNPNLTISGGFSIFDSKHPLYQIADNCGDKEDISKDEGRNRIYILERNSEKLNSKYDRKIAYESINWDRARTLFKDFRPIYKEYLEKNSDINRAIFRTLISARNDYLDDPESMNWLINLHYYISRNENFKQLINEHPKLKKYFDTVYTTGTSPIYDIDLPLSVIDLRGRSD